MESVALDMDELFGAEAEMEDVDQAPQMLPDLPDHQDQDQDQGQEEQDETTENKKVLDKLKGMKGASKNTVKKPMPKLDATRLIGERGIPILPRIFENVKLKGKGHEVEDLRVVMRYLEHWGHRLFPSMPFDEVVERVEKLGAKREVQTCVKKMRMDMPVLGSDTVDRDDGDEEEDGERDATQDHTSQQEPSAADRFDAMIQAEEEVEAELGLSQRDTTRGQRSDPQSPDPSTSDRGQGSASSQQHCETASTSTALSAEMQERIAEKRRLAMEKRARKLGIPVTPAATPASVPASGNTEPARKAQNDDAQLTNQSSQSSSQPSSQPVVPDNQPDSTTHQLDQPDQSSQKPDQPDSSSNQQDQAKSLDNEQGLSDLSSKQPDTKPDQQNISSSPNQPDVISSNRPEQPDILSSSQPDQPINQPDQPDLSNNQPDQPINQPDQPDLSSSQPDQPDKPDQPEIPDKPDQSEMNDSQPDQPEMS